MMFAKTPPLLLRAGIFYLIRHPWQLLLALIGISMGVAVVLAVDIANSAAKAAFAVSSEQIRGTATHRIINASGRLGQGIYQKLFAQPGSPPIAPVIKTNVRIPDHSSRFQLIGIDVLAERNFKRAFTGEFNDQLTLGKWLSDPEAVIISRSAADRLEVEVGDSLPIRHKGRDFKLRVRSINNLESDSSRSLLIVDIATAQYIRDEGNTLSYIDVMLADKDQKSFASLLPNGSKLVEINQQTEGVLGLSAAFELNLTAMSLLAMLVGVFLIYNAISFSIVQRRNLLGRLRSLGVLSKELYKVIMLEALIVGVLGSLIGILLGVWLGQGLTGIVAATVSELYYDVSVQAVHVENISLLKAGLIGLLGTFLAALLPAVQASRTKPLTTLSRAAYEQSIHKQIPALALAGFMLALAGLLIAFYMPGGLITGFVGLFSTVIGMVLTTPLILQKSSGVLALIFKNLIWQMSVRDMDRHISRLATATAALMLAISASVGIAIMVDSMRFAVSSWLDDLLTGDLYVAADGYEEGAYLQQQVIDEVLKLQPVNDVSLYRNLRLQLANRKTHLIAASLSAQSRKGFKFIAGSNQRSWADFDKGDVILSEPLAYRMNLSVGDNIYLPTPTGEKKFRVSGIFSDFASEHGRVFMNLTIFQTHWLDQRINTLALFSDKLDAQALHELIDETVNDRNNLILTKSQTVIEESMAVFDRTFRITEVLRLLSILVAFVGIFSAMMAVLLERKKEFAVLRALGLTQKQISQLILTESGMLGLLAALLAVPTGILMAWILTDVIQQRAFGWSMPFQVSLEPVLIAILLGVSAAVIASLYPAWTASRRNPAPLLRED